MPLAPRCPGGPGSGASSAGRSHSGLRENGLMATHNEAQVTISRVLARPVTRDDNCSPPDSSLDPGI